MHFSCAKMLNFVWLISGQQNMSSRFSTTTARSERKFCRDFLFVWWPNFLSSWNFLSPHSSWQKLLSGILTHASNDIWCVSICQLLSAIIHVQFFDDKFSTRHLTRFLFEPFLASWKIVIQLVCTCHSLEIQNSLCVRVEHLSDISHSCEFMGLPILLIANSAGDFPQT